MNGPVIVEICADSVESALAAERGGAHRIELCSNLLEGGVTPSAGLISTLRSKLNIDLYVMIRPRGGDFCYSAEEFQTMEQDVLMAKKLGADGIVFGILQENGDVDLERTRCLIQMVRPLKATFHRAFDMSRDLAQALEDVIKAGAHRILTSGGEQKGLQGIPIIAELTRAADTRLAIMAGGGINEANVHRVIEETGVREIHASVRAHLPSPMQHRNEKISMGPAKGREYQRVMVLEEKVTRLLEAARDGAHKTAKTH
ncbi:MAG TPA: copper homeostasis protein CutC [Terriglobales bacterium]|nr:copper homeostasis protein CutC [Terriglobales bacterium]